MNTSITRRDFVRLGAGAVAAGAAVKTTLLEPPALRAESGGDATGRKIRFVSIGTGIRGCDLLRSARQVATGECVGNADLYTMHQKAGQEAYGSDIPTTRDYRSLLDRYSSIWRHCFRPCQRFKEYNPDHNRRAGSGLQLCFRVPRMAAVQMERRNKDGAS